MLFKYHLLLRTVLDSQLLFVSVSSQVEGSGLTKSITHVLLLDLDPIFNLDLFGLYTNF